MKEQEEQDGQDRPFWRASISKPSEKDSEVDENGVVKSEDKMPTEASNLFEEWGSDLADRNKRKVSSWRQ